MAKRSYSVDSVTPTATADAATPLATNTTLGVIQGGTTIQRNVISEIFMGGQAGASAPSIMVLGQNGVAATVIVVGTGGRLAPLDGATEDLVAPADIGRAYTIAPQRSATLGHILNLSFNAFGGIVRWLAAPGEEISMVGLAVDTGSIGLSAFTGTSGLMGSHIIFETV